MMLENRTLFIRRDARFADGTNVVRVGVVIIKAYSGRALAPSKMQHSGTEHFLFLHNKYL